MKKIFKFQTTAGERFKIGTFNKGELLHSDNREFKTYKGAVKSLKKDIQGVKW